MKVPFSVLRMQGYTSVVYTDNSCLQGGSYESCLKNVNDTIIMLPLLSLIHLGFIINSKDMTLKLTEEKEKKNYDYYTKPFEKSKPTVQFVAQITGNIVASFPAVQLGPLSFRAIETDKFVGLKRYRQNYDAEIELSNEA